MDGNMVMEKFQAKEEDKENTENTMVKKIRMDDGSTMSVVRRKARPTSPNSPWSS